MTIRPVRNEADYDAALAEIDRLMGAAPGTPEGDALEVLVTLVERRRRPLSLAMIRALAAEWSLPAEVLVREYDLATP